MRQLDSAPSSIHRHVGLAPLPQPAVPSITSRHSKPCLTSNVAAALGPEVQWHGVAPLLHIAIQRLQDAAGLADQGAADGVKGQHLGGKGGGGTFVQRRGRWLTRAAIQCVCCCGWRPVGLCTLKPLHR